MTDIMNIGGIDCYEKDGMAYLRLETVARGLDIMKTDRKGDVEYRRVNKQALQRWLFTFGTLNSENDDLPEFIPENIFYRLAMKAENEAASDYLEYIYQCVVPQLIACKESNIANELCVFENNQFGRIRALTVNDEPWFVAADVCKALEISNPTDAIKRLDDDERARFNLGRQGEANFVNEPGLYSLVLGSRKPEAKAFKRWLTHDVIPSIRKTGRYYTQKGTPNTESLRGLASILRAVDIPLAAQKVSPETRARQAKILMDTYGLPRVPDYVKEDPWQSQQLRLESAPQTIQILLK